MFKNPVGNPPGSTQGDRRSVLAWCLYDWGNSAFATVIITFVFSVYFGRGIVGDETLGASHWSLAIALSGVLIAVLSPFLGAVADEYGARKPWVLGFTLVMCAATMALYSGAPGASAGQIVFIIAMVVLANTAFEMALMFNNAMLPQIAPPDRMGRVSGWAWGMGYAGGLACLVIALVFLVGLGDTPPLLNLPQEQSENIRAVAPFVALWVLVFTIPMMLFTHDAPRSAKPLGLVMRSGGVRLVEGLRAIRGYPNLVRFLVASAIYRDGLNTLFAMGGIYAAGVYGMSFQEILIFAIGLNVTSGIGAMLFAYMDDLRGSRQTVLLSLAGLITAGVAVLLAADKTMFIGLAMLMGLFIGPVQSASRTMAARIAPAELVGQTFGLYSLTGRVVAFFGPALYGWAILMFNSQQAGMATILMFWLIGMMILAGVKDDRREG